MFRLSNSMGVAVALTAFLLVGCPEKYKPSTDGGTPENTFAACQDGVDNDEDGLTDCADSDCSQFDFCTETDCSNGLDDDNDGLTDCMDPDCQGGIDCQENNSAACNDNIDNDGDGATDCDDTDCAGIPPCDSESNCDDGVDNDNDGLTDCADPDCATSVDCPGGFCYDVAFQAPAVWGMAITEANDDLDPNTACVQYEVVVQATAPEPGTLLCLYLDDLNGTAEGCEDPNTQNPVTFQVNLCAGQHMLYARVERGMDVCEQVNIGLEQIEVQVYENPSCTITLPAGLSEDSNNPTCWDQLTMGIQVTTSGADAQLWVDGSLAGTDAANAGIVDFPGTALGSDDTIIIRALCDNAGSGNGDAWSPDYHVQVDTQAPNVQFVSPSSPASYSAADCVSGFDVTVTGAEAGQQICANYVGQTPNANGCATSTGPTEVYVLNVTCVDGLNLDVEVTSGDACGNQGQDIIQVTADTGIPVVLIESPANGQLYNKAADTLDPATDALEVDIRVCTDQAYNPGGVTLLVGGNPVTGVTPTIQAAACLTQNFEVTWSVPYAFAAAGTGLQRGHDIEVQIDDGINVGSGTAAFTVDTIAPVLSLSCGICEPSQSFYTSADDVCPGAPFQIPAVIEVTGLEVGETVSLAVSSGGTPVPGSPYSATSQNNLLHQLSLGACGVQATTGQNVLDFTATDQAGNTATIQRTVSYAQGVITAPLSGTVVSNDCGAGPDFGIEVEVELDTTITDGSQAYVTVESVLGGWSYQSSNWSTDCSSQGSPCTHTFCVGVPPGTVEQSDIAVKLFLNTVEVPGGPENVIVDNSDPGPPTGLNRTVVNRRAAQVQLDWDSVEDAQSGVLAEWEVRCVEDGTISAANWGTAMQYVGEPVPASAGTAQSMLVAEDLNGAKMRAGHSYSCGIRGRSQANRWSTVAVFPDVTVADLAFIEYSMNITGATGGARDYLYYPSIVAAGNINGDLYDDMLVGYGIGNPPSNPAEGTARLIRGSAAGPSAGVDITCSDLSFGGGMAGIGDYDGAIYSAGDPVAYPDIAIGSPHEDTVYIWRGNAALGSVDFDCGSADIVIQGEVGTCFGNTITPIGDFDGDGLKDFAISAGCRGSYAGATYIVFGRDWGSYSPAITIDLASGTNSYGAYRIAGSANFVYSGSGVAGADLDADGFSDVIVGAAAENTLGEVGILYGNDAFSPTPNALNPIGFAGMDAFVVNPGPAANQAMFAWRAIAPMDFDGDGCLDLVVGAPGDNVGTATTNVGNVFVFLGQKSGSVCTGAINSTHSNYARGETQWDLLGHPIANMINMTLPSPAAWKLNGIVGSPSDAAIFAGATQYHRWTATDLGPGYAGLWYAGFSGNVTASDADVLFNGPAGSAEFHWVSYVGDLDGDGYVDLAIGDTAAAGGGSVVLYR